MRVRRLARNNRLNRIAIQNEEHRGRNGTKTRNERSPIQNLQQEIGNRAVQELLTAKNVEPSQRIGSADEENEQEANRIRRQVMEASKNQRQGPCSCGDRCAGCTTAKRNQSFEDHGHDNLGRETQRRISIMRDVQERDPNRSEKWESRIPHPDQLHSLSGRSRGGGTELDPGALGPMQAYFDRDLSSVRIHTDRRAANSANAMNANAYTIGHDIFFGTGRYAPETKTGLGLLAHELAHVVQQSGGQSPDVQFNRDYDDLTRQYVNEALSHHELVARLTSQHWLSPEARRRFLRSYFTQLFLAWDRSPPTPERLDELVEQYDQIVREHESHRETAREEAAEIELIDELGDPSTEPVLGGADLEEWRQSTLSGYERRAGEEVDPYTRLIRFISIWDYLGLDWYGYDQFLFFRDTREYYMIYVPFFFRNPSEFEEVEEEFLRKAEDFREWRRQTGIPQEEFARQGRQVKAELNLGVIQSALPFKGIVETVNKGWTLIESGYDVHQCVHKRDDGSCVKLLQRFVLHTVGRDAAWARRSPPR